MNDKSASADQQGLEAGPIDKEQPLPNFIDHGPPINEPPPTKPRFSNLNLTFWISVNVLATIAIVFTNKHLLTRPVLSHTQLLFAAYHFLITHLTLHLCSSTLLPFRQNGPLFPRATLSISALLPISIAMALNVLLPNLSLALSSVTFYQTVRVLLTPTVAVLDRLVYGQRLSRRSTLALIPVCLGVAMVTWADVRPASPSKAGLLSQWRGQPQQGSKGTSMLGATCALLGVLASGVYAVFIARYQVKLEVSAVQLLHRQSLVGGVLLMYFVPWLDRLPVWEQVTDREWVLILVSGLCAVGINLSQFVIVRDAGPVGSTVVGHAKTVGVVGLGWWVQGGGWRERGIVGVLIAVGGIVVWTWIEMKERRMRETKP